jgi:hypothetical protein
MGTSKQSVVKYETYDPATGQGVTISDIERQKKSKLIDQSIRNYLTGTAGIKGVTPSPYSGWINYNEWLAERKGKKIKTEEDQKPQKIKKVKPEDEFPYGYRPDGTLKSRGVLDPIKIKDGRERAITELSITVNINGVETPIPLLVPTLTEEEVYYLATGNTPTKEIIDKAIEYAKMRISRGESPFFEKGRKKIKQPASVAEHFAEEFKKVKEEKEKAKEPHLKMIEEIQKALNETIKKQDEFLESYKKDVEKAISGIQEITKKELPTPPKFEDVEKPKNLAQAITKILVPAIVGIATVFRKDKLAGYNYFYFNSMMDAIKKNDLETYQQLLNQWKIDYEYAKEKKQNELEIAKIELQKIENSAKITSTQIEKQIKIYSDRINQEEKMLQEIDKTFNKTIDFLYKFGKLRLEELKFAEEVRHNRAKEEIQRARLSKEDSYKDKLRKEVKDTFFKLLSKVDISSLTREQLAHLLMSAFMSSGVKPSEDRFEELYEELSEGLISKKEGEKETKQKSK